jgi:hypothetical protein
MKTPAGSADTIAILAGDAGARLQLLSLYNNIALVIAICLSCVALGILLWRLPRWRLLLTRSAGLHKNRRASASLEFLLVFMPLLILVLAIWQLAFMLNAQMHVGYAAYAAARSASTITYMNLPDEPEGVLLNSDEPDAQKWQRIERAALPGTLAISPGSPDAAARALLSSEVNVALGNQGIPDFDGLDLAAVPGQISLMTVHRGDDILQGSRISRAAVKALYAQNATRVLINGRDAGGRDDGGGSSSNPYDLTGSSVLRVTVEYDFWLNVPYAGRMMRLAFGGVELPDDDSYPTLTLRETVAINTWPRLSAY